MTPGARIAAAIALLDEIQAGASAERALTRWARTNRYAGSKDRAAVRDHVYDVLRRKLSAAAHGRGTTGRAMMLGLLYQTGADIEALFSGQGYSPEPLTEAEAVFDPGQLDQTAAWNIPEWLIPEFQRSLNDNAYTTAMELQERAPVVLRANTAKVSRSAAQDALRQDGIETQINPVCDTALTVTSNPRKIRTSEAYNTGMVELQDASSQAVVQTIESRGRVLDYCAGGGGKALALAADAHKQVFAHDAYAARMRDLSFRANRAGVMVEILDRDAVDRRAPFDAVLCDVPCSGSGAWRRDPAGKWNLTAEKLKELNDLQDGILKKGAALVAPDGTLIYATCSVLTCENEDRIASFVGKEPGWKVIFSQRFDVTDNGDGFFVAHLTRA